MSLDKPVEVFRNELEKRLVQHRCREGDGLGGIFTSELVPR
jgi:hypothetical protein